MYLGGLGMGLNIDHGSFTYHENLLSLQVTGWGSLACVDYYSNPTFGKLASYQN